MYDNESTKDGRNTWKHKITKSRWDKEKTKTSMAPIKIKAEVFRLDKNPMCLLQDIL